MLILTRKHGKTIRIGDDIKVPILSQNGQHHRIGITAPKEMPVHREEVYERIKEET